MSLSIVTIRGGEGRKLVRKWKKSKINHIMLVGGGGKKKRPGRFNLQRGKKGFERSNRLFLEHAGKEEEGGGEPAVGDSEEKYRGMFLLKFRITEKAEEID